MDNQNYLGRMVILFGKIGLPELILILVIALIIFGPRKLPEIGRSIGRGIREFRQATTEISRTVSLDDEEEKSEFQTGNEEKKNKETLPLKDDEIATETDENKAVTEAKEKA